MQIEIEGKNEVGDGRMEGDIKVTKLFGRERGVVCSNNVKRNSRGVLRDEREEGKRGSLVGREGI